MHLENGRGGRDGKNTNGRGTVGEKTVGEERLEATGGMAVNSLRESNLQDDNNFEIVLRSGAWVLDSV